MPSSAPTAIYTLSLHDALPILGAAAGGRRAGRCRRLRGDSLGTPPAARRRARGGGRLRRQHRRRQLFVVVAVAKSCPYRRLVISRSEEHTSELQSPCNLVCRLLRPLRSTLFPYTTLFRSWERLRVVAEPGGAAAFAAILSGRHQPRAGERVAVVVSGANTDAVSFS